MIGKDYSHQVGGEVGIMGEFVRKAPIIFKHKLWCWVSSSPESSCYCACLFSCLLPYIYLFNNFVSATVKKGNCLLSPLALCTGVAPSHVLTNTKKVCQDQWWHWDLVRFNKPKKHVRTNARLQILSWRWLGPGKDNSYWWISLSKWPTSDSIT